MPSRAEHTTNQVFDTLITALRQGAVDAPAWHLTSTHRWRLLRDTLLGHVRVRGAIRPRDLPLDKSCQDVIDSAIAILSLKPYRWDNADIQFRHWLGIFSLLPLATSTACETCPTSDDDLLTATILELSFACGGRTLQNAHDVADLPYVQRLIGVVGLSQQEWHHLVSRYQDDVSNRKRTPSHDAILARWAARVIALEDPPKPRDFPTRHAWRARLAEQLSPFQGRWPEIRDALAVLDERACRYVTLKAERPQRYINRGTRHWLLRGASAWCSQSLALARDLMCENDSLLFSDSDAIVGMWFPRTASEADLQKQLDGRLADFWRLTRDGGGMPGRFPRLADWLEASLPTAVGLDRDTNLPALSVWCRSPLTVLEIALSKFLDEEIRDRQTADEPAPKGSCTRVNGDIAVSFRTPPPWLQDENEGEESPAGVTSMIWALCGTAFRTHAHEGLCSALKPDPCSSQSEPDPTLHLRLQAVKHGDWLQQLNMRDESIVHLKMDGDGVGDRFRKQSVADFPWLSMQLARMVQRRLVAGVAATLASCPPGDGKSGPTLPVDVVYVGGDDVYVILPDPMLDPFLDGFGGSLASIADNPWNDTTFTFVAARLKPKSELLAGVEPPKSGAGSARSDRLAAANLAAARLVTEGLGTVKEVFKSQAVLDPHGLQGLVDEAISTSQLADHAMRLELLPSPLRYGVDVGDGRSILSGRMFVVGPPAVRG